MPLVGGRRFLDAGMVLQSPDCTMIRHLDACAILGRRWIWLLNRTVDSSMSAEGAVYNPGSTRAYASRAALLRDPPVQLLSFFFIHTAGTACIADNKIHDVYYLAKSGEEHDDSAAPSPLGSRGDSDSQVKKWRESKTSV